MPQSLAEEDALRLLQAAKARLELIGKQRQRDGSFLTSFRLAQAKAMVLAAERRLQQSKEAQLDAGP